MKCAAESITNSVKEGFMPVIPQYGFVSECFKVVDARKYLF